MYSRSSLCKESWVREHSDCSLPDSAQLPSVHLSSLLAPSYNQACFPCSLRCETVLSQASYLQPIEQIDCECALKALLPAKMLGALSPDRGYTAPTTFLPSFRQLNSIGVRCSILALSLLASKSVRSLTEIDTGARSPRYRLFGEVDIMLIDK